jgi:hypothetical protein
MRLRPSRQLSASGDLAVPLLLPGLRLLCVGLMLLSGILASHAARFIDQNCNGIGREHARALEYLKRPSDRPASSKSDRSSCGLLRRCMLALCRYHGS